MRMAHGTDLERGIATLLRQRDLRRVQSRLPAQMLAQAAFAARLGERFTQARNITPWREIQRWIGLSKVPAGVARGART